MTVGDLMAENPLVSIKVWRDDDGTWMAHPERGPYPWPHHIVLPDDLPIADGPDAASAVQELLSMPIWLSAPHAPEV